MTRIIVIAAVVWLEMIRRKDIYVLLILLGGLLVILVSLNVFGLGGTTRYVTDIGLLTAWVFGWALAISISTRELPQEEARRTIFPLLAKPLTRFELIIGKWLGSWTMVSIAVLLFYMLIHAVVLMKGGKITQMAFLQSYVLHCFALAIITSIGMAFSTRLNHDAAASISYILTGAAFLVVPHIPKFLVLETGLRANALTIIYNLLPHFEVFDMRQIVVHKYPPIACSTMAIISAYGLILTSLFLLVAWLAYRNKTFSRMDQG
ncbi:MAG: ABC transporter permease [Kiritimatiellae bacterium]|nr:ABC transporter permease [Kiritimatiellia bacterium]